MSTLQSLTQRQFDVLSYINAFIQTAGYAPSFEEIADACNLSSLATIHKHVCNLERKGYITRNYNRSRTVAVTLAAKKLIHRVDEADAYIKASALLTVGQ